MRSTSLELEKADLMPTPQWTALHQAGYIYIIKSLLPYLEGFVPSSCRCTSEYAIIQIYTPLFVHSFQTAQVWETEVSPIQTHLRVYECAITSCVKNILGGASHLRNVLQLWAKTGFLASMLSVYKNPFKANQTTVM